MHSSSRESNCVSRTILAPAWVVPALAPPSLHPCFPAVVHSNSHERTLGLHFMTAFMCFVAGRIELEHLRQLELQDKETRNLLKFSIMNICVYYSDSSCSESSPFAHILDFLNSLFVFLSIFHLLNELQVLCVASRQHRPFEWAMWIFDCTYSGRYLHILRDMVDKMESGSFASLSICFCEVKLFEGIWQQSLLETWKRYRLHNRLEQRLGLARLCRSFWNLIYSKYVAMEGLERAALRIQDSPR